MAGGAVVALLVGGAAVAVATTGGSGTPTGLCVAEGSPVTGAKADASGAWTCPTGRALVVVPAQEAVRALQSSVESLDGRLRYVENVQFGDGQRLHDAEQRLLTAEDGLATADGRLGSAEGRLDALDSAAASARQRLAAVESRLTTLEQRTALSTVSAPVSFSATTVRQTVSCGTGRALSGSARTTEATVAQSAVNAEGTGWAFEVRSTGKAPAATLLVVCAGAPGTASPTPGGVTGPPTAEPDTGTSPGTSPTP